MTETPKPHPPKECPTVVRDADGCPIGIDWKRIVEEKLVISE